jgi:hypothetical protein
MSQMARRSFVVTVRPDASAAEVEDTLDHRRARVERLADVGTQISQWLGQDPTGGKDPAGNEKEKP